MRSRAMLALHTVVFFGLVVVCFSSPVIAAYYPETFKSYALWTAGILAVLIIGSWRFYGNGRYQCPLTVWENKLREREGMNAYTEACMDRYAQRWFGITLPRRFSDVFPVAILLMPLATWLFI